MPRELLLLISLLLAGADGPLLAAGLPIERHPGGDGANCVALLSRLLNLSSANRSTPLRTLADTAVELRRLGAQAAVYRMQTDDPGRIPVPSIVYCEAGDPDLGRLIVFLGISDSGACIVFDGATAIIEAQAVDEFMRSFTGHGVMVQPPAKTSLLVSGTRLLGGLALCGGVLALCRNRKLHRDVTLNPR